MEEAFGWTDVRADTLAPISDMKDISTTAGLDAKDTARAVGPRDQYGKLLYTDTRWFPHPGGTAARCPMYAMQRPPFAVTNRLVHNPINADGPRGGDASTYELLIDGDEWLDENLDYEMYNLPVEPAVDNWDEFAAGNLSPMMETVGMAWFRIYREPEEMHNGIRNDVTSSRNNGIADWFDVEAMPGHHGIFIVTCGSGGTLGYRDWDEVLMCTTADNRPFDEATFKSLREAERILWYRIEWSPGVLAGSYSNIGQERNPDRFRTAFNLDKETPALDDLANPKGEIELSRNPPVITRSVAGDTGKYYRGAGNTDWGTGDGSNKLEGGVLARNQTGTIDWVMRLEREPPEW